MFVHRNIANVVVNTDLNLLSVVQYVVEVLGVQDIIVCGHYGGGGVHTAMGDKQFGLIDNWLRHIKDVISLHQEELDAITNEKAKFNRTVELHVIEQVNNLYKTSIIQKALKAGKQLRLHSLVFDIASGTLKNVNWSPDNFKQYAVAYHLPVNKEVEQS